MTVEITVYRLVSTVIVGPPIFQWLSCYLVSDLSPIYPPRALTVVNLAYFGDGCRPIARSIIKSPSMNKYVTIHLTGSWSMQIQFHCKCSGPACPALSLWSKADDNFLLGLVVFCVCLCRLSICVGLLLSDGFCVPRFGIATTNLLWKSIAAVFVSFVVFCGCNIED